jgi:outer membrane murein-binding lipoprotein Lpp
MSPLDEIRWLNRKQKAGEKLSPHQKWVLGLRGGKSPPACRVASCDSTLITQRHFDQVRKLEAKVTKLQEKVRELQSKIAGAKSALSRKKNIVRVKPRKRRVDRVLSKSKRKGCAHDVWLGKGPARRCPRCKKPLGPKPKKR